MLEKFKDYYKTDNSGVYALYLSDCGTIDIFGEKIANIIAQKMTNQLLYIGETTNLSRRIEKDHLKKSKTSALRRTIASLLNMEFISISGRKKLTPENEKIITDWINDNTYFKILETQTVKEAKIIEEELIRQYQPPLNKKGCEEHF